MREENDLLPGGAGRTEEVTVPIFPQWLRRLDPLLNAEDTNKIFQTFQHRRRTHRRVWRFDMLYDAPKTISFALGLLFFCLLFLGKSVMGIRISVLVYIVGVVYSMWILSFLVLVVQFFMKKKKQNYLVLPMRVGGVFRTLDYLEQQAFDLWLAGARGTEVAQAIYLELWESMYRRVKFVAPVLVFFVFYNLGDDLQNRGLADLYFYPLAILLIVEIAIALMIGISFIGYIAIDIRHDCWLKYLNYTRFMLRNVAGILFAVVLILGFVMLARSARDIQGFLVAFFNTDEIAALTLKLLVITVALFIILIVSRRYILRRTERRMQQMDAVFTRLMHHHLMGDPDA
ncbi:hypothetical protein IT570_05860 [Candidatus Sumerlaeota bacterium]|nr:hypothetical protein [Candidatus Sumerlaeota bacterium]